MRVTRNEQSSLANSLNSSVDVKTLLHLAKTIILDSYDIYERTGFPASMSIPKKDVINQILRDIIDNNLYLEFISSLIDLQESGFKGRKFTIINLRNIVQGLIERGYLYDAEIRHFVENSALRKTRNWGFLQNKQEYSMTFLSIDLVKNSNVVKNNPKEIVQKAYSDVRNIVQDSVLNRNGRLWSWEGDGGTAAFALSGRNSAAALAAIEILHKLLLYNGTENCLSNPLQIRMAVHSGPYEYSDKQEDLGKSETVQQTIKIQHEYTPPDSVTISIVVRNMLDDIIARQFKLIEKHGHYQYFNYAVEWEK
jgi:class 3 adenylate cyclase